MPFGKKNNNVDGKKAKSNDGRTDQQAGSSTGSGTGTGVRPSHKIRSTDKSNKNVNTKPSGSRKHHKAQSNHLEEDNIENASVSGCCSILARKSRRVLNTKGSSKSIKEEAAKKKKRVRFLIPSTSKQRLRSKKASLTSKKPTRPDHEILKLGAHILGDVQRLLKDGQTPEKNILNELIQTALANTSDAIAESIINDTLECVFENTSEAIAMDIVNEIIDRIPDEKVIYTAEYWDSGRLSQVLLDGSTVKRRSFLPYMPLTSKANFIKMFKQVFLPHGFPETVSTDYAEYQLWDSLQAFFSTLTGALTTHSLMKGFGVGDAEATAASAAMTWLLRDGAGLVGRIVFAYWKGREFDMDCKKWRFFADILNDTAMFCECMVPVLIPSWRIYLMCVSTTMKSLVGVAGGATRAALTQHQAIGGNMADVSAKDQSQECCVNLIASIIGILMLMTVADSRYKWEMFVFFVFAHLVCNYRAVKAVQLATLNTARFLLIVRCYLLLKVVGSVKGINHHESVIIGRGYGVVELCGFNIKLGVSVRDVKIPKTKFNQLLEFYKKYCYILYVDRAENSIQVFLKESATSTGIIQAFYHAIILAIATCLDDDQYLMIISKKFERIQNTPVDQLINIIFYAQPVSNNCGDVVMNAAEEVVRKDFPQFFKKLLASGWDVDHLQFEIGESRGVV